MGGYLAPPLSGGNRQDIDAVVTHPPPRWTAHIWRGEVLVLVQSLGLIDGEVARRESVLRHPFVMHDCHGLR
jgi:hypothetical protein